MPTASRNSHAIITDLYHGTRGSGLSGPCAVDSMISVDSEAGGDVCARPRDSSRLAANVSKGPGTPNLSQSGPLSHTNDAFFSDDYDPSLGTSVDTEPPAPSEGPIGNVIDIVNALRMRFSSTATQGDSVRRVREDKLQQIEKRRCKATRRFDLVEEMFARAVGRRVRAMRRIAADPPAERLIGHSSLQHIPLALLPRQVRQTALALSEPQPQLQSQQSKEAEPVERAVNVFITDVETKAAGGSGSPAGEKSESSSSGGSGGGGSSKGGEEEGEEEERGAPGEKGETKGDPSLNEELLRRWRELGYTAVFLPATRRLIDPRRPLHAQGSFRPEPLPPVHLVQRRLPEQPTPPTKRVHALPLVKTKHRASQR